MMMMMADDSTEPYSPVGSSWMATREFPFSKFVMLQQLRSQLLWIQPCLYSLWNDDFAVVVPRFVWNLWFVYECHSQHGPERTVRPFWIPSIII
jgi:hypothetical protein